MYGKFTYYSIAQLYAIRLGQPVAIFLGEDNLYWVVDHSLAGHIADTGRSMLLNSPS